MAHQLSWSNYVEILPINDLNEVKYYINIYVNQNLSKGNLRQRIKTNEYKRLDENTKLKITELKKEHIGQIQVYMNYINSNLKTDKQEKTIGIIICKKNNEFIMEYCSDSRIIAKEYELI